MNWYEDAFAAAFSTELNKIAWDKVGAAPLTRKCLESGKVQHTSESDPNHVVYKRIEAGAVGNLKIKIQRFFLRLV